MISPNFIIAGFPKCGTTSLYHYLKQHPDICMSTEKEPHFYSDFSLDYRGYKDKDYFFGKKAVYKQAQYDLLYAHCKLGSLKGEASTNTLYLDSYIPKNTSLIVGLRNPVTRAYSHYLQMRRLKRETKPFRKALLLESKRIQKGFSPPWHYTSTGFYSKYLNKTLDYNTHFYFFEDFVKDPNKVLNEIVSFLNLKEFSFDTTRVYNSRGKEPMSKRLYRYLPGRFQYKGLIDQPFLLESDKEYLYKIYKTEFFRLQEFFDYATLHDVWNI